MLSMCRSCANSLRARRQAVKARGADFDRRNHHAVWRLWYRTCFIGCFAEALQNLDVRDSWGFISRSCPRAAGVYLPYAFTEQGAAQCCRRGVRVSTTTR